jgi:hypothetical protein
MNDFGNQNGPLLKSALSCAVPLWIEGLRGTSFDERQAFAVNAANIIAEKGDLILFKSKKKGESAAAFNALAKAIAVLAYQPGGVTSFGMHFEANPKKD